MRRKRIRIPFTECASQIPVVELKMKGKKVIVLVDTGAESTLFDKTFVKDNNLDYVAEDMKMSFVGAGGESGCTPVVHVSAYMNGAFKLEGMVSNLSPIAEHFATIYGDRYKPSILLGSDNLDKYDAKLDYEKKEMTLLV